MTKFISELITEEFIDSKYAQLEADFIFKSDVLGVYVVVPTGFVCDYESVPIFKASSKHAGVLHDYLCRFDSTPIVTKAQAADVYLEAQEERDRIMNNNLPFRMWRWFLREMKTGVVRVAWGYFHKHSVKATLEDIRECRGIT